MSGTAYFERFEIESSREVDGQLLVSGRTIAGERFEDVLLQQPHGAASRPKAGAVGTLSIMPGFRAQATVFGVEHNEERPTMAEGDAVLYAHGSKLLIFADGAVFDLAGKQATFTAAGWTVNGPATINGDVTINGALSVSGNITSGGTITDADGDGGA